MRHVTFRLLPFLIMLVACSSNGQSSAETTVESPPPSVSSGVVTVTEPPAADPLAGELTYEIIATYPHSTSSFTQGLEFLDNGQLVESVGLTGQSGRTFIDIETGAQIGFEALSQDEFAEGLTQVGDELYQITWVSGTAIVSDANTLKEKRRYEYDGEGWGLCWSGSELVMSDGTKDLTFRDPDNFSVLRTVRVRSEELGLGKQLNELECVGSQIWANVYFKNHLIAINPLSGEVEAWVDLNELAPEKLDNLDVMNGIAYRPETDTFFITGKNWAQMFELRLSAR